MVAGRTISVVLFFILFKIFVAEGLAMASEPSSLYIMGSTVAAGGYDYSDQYRFVGDSEHVLRCNNVPIYPSASGGIGEFVLSTISGSEWKTGTYMMTGSETTFGDSRLKKCSLVKGMGVFSVSAGVYDFYVDFSETSPVLYIFESEYRVPQELYLLGTLKENSVFDAEGERFDRDGDGMIFRLEGVEVMQDDPSVGRIALSVSNGDNWSRSLCYRAVATINEVGTYRATFVSGGYNTALFTIPSGKYNFAVDFTHLFPALSIEEYHDDISTGVGSVCVESDDVEYYSLEGVKVDCPSGGLYVRRIGAKSSLVWF